MAEYEDKEVRSYSGRVRALIESLKEKGLANPDLRVIGIQMRDYADVSQFIRRIQDAHEKTKGSKLRFKDSKLACSKL